MMMTTKKKKKAMMIVIHACHRVGMRKGNVIKRKRNKKRASIVADIKKVAVKMRSVDTNGKINPTKRTSIRNEKVGMEKKTMTTAATAIATTMVGKNDAV